MAGAVSQRNAPLGSMWEARWCVYAILYFFVFFVKHKGFLSILRGTIEHSSNFFEGCEDREDSGYRDAKPTALHPLLASFCFVFDRLLYGPLRVL